MLILNKIQVMTENTPTFSVFGGGSWATAIVKMLCENQEKVTWYMRNEEAIHHIKTQHHNPNYLSSIEFDIDQLDLTSDINYAVNQGDYLFFVIPSAFLSSELSSLTTSLEGKVIFSAIKGIVPESYLIVGEHFNEKLGVPFENIGVITGPCHAEEVALERLSYLTIACAEEAHAKYVAENLSSEYIKCKVTEDVIGTEYAAVLKNIYAIAAGIAHGLGYGDNFQSVLMSNSIREMKRFIKKRYKMKRNINDSAYLGDLLVTGYSTFSRNRFFCNMIGKGYTVRSAQMEMNMVAEGYYAVKSAYIINEQNGKKKVKTPIINAVHRVLYENKNPRKVFAKLAEKLD